MARSLPLERGFLLAEEQAMIAKLSDIYLKDPKAPDGRVKVRTYFRHPPAEQERAYPSIDIDLISIDFAADRAHSAQTYPVNYWPSEYATFEAYATAKGLDYDPAVDFADAVEFHPYDIYFSVTTHTRHPQQDRALTAALLNTAFLPDRWGFLYVPADNTYRHLDRMGFTNLDGFETNPQTTERVYRKSYTIRVSAHMAPEYPFIFNRVLQVAGQIYCVPADEVLAQWNYEPEE
jgi:hypothetical protein